MAQYYHPRPATTSSEASDTHIEVISSRDRQHRNGEYENALASSSILVFPNPPSEQETSRSESRFEFTGSTPSLPTDLSFGSVRSRSESRSEMNPHEIERSWRNTSGNFHPNCDRFSLEEESDWESDAGDSRTRWEHLSHANHLPPSGGHTRTSSNLSSLNTGSLSLTPQPPFRLPFLSFLRIFLSLDDSTLHLLSRSPDPQSSVLFPFSPGSTFPSCEESEAEPKHGVRKLLLHNPDKPQNRALLAMDPSESPAGANPLLASPMRIPVWLS